MIRIDGIHNIIKKLINIIFSKNNIYKYNGNYT